MFPSPFEVEDDLREAFLRYIDTAYALRNRDLADERRELLLGGQTNLFAPLMIEPVLPYDGVAGVDETADAAGVDRSVLLKVVTSVFGVRPDDLQSVRLRHHQVEALRTHFGDGARRNPVVTSGTGSGKTESFLIPLLTRIASEKGSTSTLPSPHAWWSIENQNHSWKPTRAQSPSPAAMRAMILYPTNALVEDQVARLRRAIRGFGSQVTPSMCGSADTPARHWTW